LIWEFQFDLGFCIEEEEEERVFGMGRVETRERHRWRGRWRGFVSRK